MSGMRFAKCRDSRRPSRRSAYGQDGMHTAKEETPMNSSSREREAVWQRAEAEGNGRVFCNLCGIRVFTGDDWDISHYPVPKSSGGTKTGVAHRRCNIKDNV